MTTPPFLLGVLGGMGPLATVDFMSTLLALTPATRDQEQIPTVVWNVPQIADRQDALAGRGPSPLPQLLNGIEKLNQAGASHIVIPCNTAHHWYSALSNASRAPLIHMVDATIATVAANDPVPRRIGIIATKGTLEAGWYQHGLQQHGITAVVPDEVELNTWFVPGCYAVKRGELAEGGAAFLQQAKALFERGAQNLILACTEVPVALRAVNAPFLPLTFDPARALAGRCSALWQDHRTSYLT
ncbi:aspartate racemase [Klebsiella sp. RIT-PI-d]|uniref:aspartate/glutamate racemase family protein n=1 Tax=Klebsiella sp. RIT-PI-d TaxID=1681196 RepID=UPI0006769EF4|nr:amino acid racemase [Klebsiella sp. RIT-PI-d]KNC12318.1 aspartate racemase [Klebsiella sp. RIT-PI-d]